MNQSTPLSLQKKVNYLMEKIEQLYHEITNKDKKNQNLLTFKLRYMTFIDDGIQKIQSIYDNEKFNRLIDSGHKQQERNLTTRTNPTNLVGYSSISEQYFDIEKEKIQLEKKLIQYRLLQVKKQESEIQRQREILILQRQKKQIENINQKISDKINKLSNEIEYLNQKIKSQDKQIQRLIFINQKQNDEAIKIKQERNKAEKQVLELRERIEAEQNEAIVSSNLKKEKFNYKNTEGLRCVRLFTNLTNEKKDHQRYVALSLPVKLQVQKIVYAIKLGIILSNKQVVYFDELFIYEKDTMVLNLQGDRLVIEYVKRKERLVLDKYKITKPQVLIMLYGKGDSIMIYDER